ncbi:YitT family protein [Alteribacillus sp. HJP-4]|uniref:YczE/YyaS/YitT family protein n=1 Tax=Alteribacillus sp. HJP-4 TaxID=2775394 RepID=UPI0035CCF3E6
MGKRIFIYLAGLAITALGIALIVHSSIGAGPWDAVAVGLKNHFGLTIGIWSIIAQAFLVTVTSLIEKARPQLESIIVIIVRSWFLDFWYYFVLSDILFAYSLETQIATFAAGLAAVGAGIGIYIEAKFPKSPVDALMIAVSTRYDWSIRSSRLLIEWSGVAVGFLLGGPVGIGTIVIALSLGRIIQMSNTQVKKVMMTPKIEASS